MAEGITVAVTLVAVAAASVTKTMLLLSRATRIRLSLVPVLLRLPAHLRAATHISPLLLWCVVVGVLLLLLPLVLLEALTQATVAVTAVTVVTEAAAAVAAEPGVMLVMAVTAAAIPQALVAIPEPPVLAAEAGAEVQEEFLRLTRPALEAEELVFWDRGLTVLLEFFPVRLLAVAVVDPAALTGRTTALARVLGPVAFTGPVPAVLGLASQVRLLSALAVQSVSFGPEQLAPSRQLTRGICNA